MLTRDEANQIIAKALAFSEFPERRAAINDTEQVFIRFANNGVTTSAFTTERTLSFSVTEESRTGTTETTQFDNDSLRATVRRAEQLADIAPPNPEDVPPLPEQNYADYDNWDQATATARAPQMIPHVKTIVEAALKQKLVAAGFFNRVAVVSAFGNNIGNFGYQRATDSRITTTIRAADGSSSGWAGQPAVRVDEIDGTVLATRAIEKCLRWKKPVRLEPGKYTVVLEPAAANDILSGLAYAFSARNAEEGRSFLSRKGGGTLRGDKLFPDFVGLRSDPFDRRFPTALWSQDLPNKPITWIENGVLKNLAYDRYWAAKTGQEPTPQLSSLIFEGGEGSTQDLIKSTKRGLLVTRFWYIRTVNPQTSQVTGLTRDGLILIEDGVITQPVVNLRFNESPFRLLQNSIRFGQSMRMQGAEGQACVVPPVLAAEFPFTSVSDAV
jgi:predicted Zn-dependent protease